MKSSRPAHFSPDFSLSLSLSLVHPTLHALCVQCKRRERAAVLFVDVVVSCGFGLFNVMALLYNAKEKESESIYIYIVCISLSHWLCVCVCLSGVRGIDPPVSMFSFLFFFSLLPLPSGLSSKREREKKGTHQVLL